MTFTPPQEYGELISQRPGSELGGLTPNRRAMSNVGKGLLRSPFSAIRTVSQTATKAASRGGRPPGLGCGLEDEDFGERRGCFHCTLYPVQRVIDGYTFVSGRNRDGSESRDRIYGVDRPEQEEPCL